MQTTRTINGCFAYANMCESNFRAYMHENADIEISTTFTTDIAIAEWCQVFGGEGQRNAVVQTIETAIRQWIGNRGYIAELLMAISIRSRYHWQVAKIDDKGKRVFPMEIHSAFSVLYSELYYKLLDRIDKFYVDNGREDDLCHIYRLIN